MQVFDAMPAANQVVRISEILSGSDRNPLEVISIPNCVRDQTNIVEPLAIEGRLVVGDLEEILEPTPLEGFQGFP